MKIRFREFVRDRPFRIALREDEAAPPMGAVPPSPSNPDTKTNSHHFELLKGQLGIDDDDFLSALSTSDTTLWKIPDYSRKWGFSVAGTCQASIEPREDGNFNVTFKFREKKLTNPHSFIFPYTQGQKPMAFKGPIDDKTEVMTPEELQNLMVVPFQNGGAPPGGGGMGGPPGGGGGMGGPPPGMGAPPGGGAGGAPPPPGGGMGGAPGVM